MEEFPTGGTTELAPIGRVDRARPSWEKQKSVTCAWGESYGVPWLLLQPWLGHTLGGTMVWGKAQTTGATQTSLVLSPHLPQQSVPWPRGAKVERDGDVTQRRGDPALSRQ